MSDTWTDDIKAELAEAYTEREPTPENTMEIIADLVEEYQEQYEFITVNGLRMILNNMKVYVKKADAPSSNKSSGSSNPRVNKAEALAALKEVIADAGAEVNEDIIDRMTGKAANYFAQVIGGPKS